MNAPPGRYKIVERDRRLVTIDTQTGTEISQTPGIAPTSQGSLAPSRPAMPMTRSEMPKARQSSLSPASDPWLRILGRMFPGVRIENGTAQIITRKAYDAQAPRALALSEAQLDRLGWLMVAAIIVGLVVFMFWAMMSFSLFGLIIPGFVLFHFGRALIKPIMIAILEGAIDRA
jgi:hypothetical protein